MYLVASAVEPAHLDSPRFERLAIEADKHVEEVAVQGVFLLKSALLRSEEG